MTQFNSKRGMVAEVVSTTALSLSDAGYSAADIAAAFRLEISTDQPCRYSFSGTPTATFGDIIEADQEPVVLDRGEGASFGDFLIIREGGVDANVTYKLFTMPEV